MAHPLRTCRSATHLLPPSLSVFAQVVQGYGLTETNAASFIAAADVFTHSATVGPPTPGTEFRWVVSRAGGQTRARD
jgi:acyl-CoA synthetase (AMP-forming)/AMP-acid ligase II